jgi:hypothetical protein
VKIQPQWVVTPGKQTNKQQTRGKKMRNQILTHRIRRIRDDSIKKEDDKNGNVVVVVVVMVVVPARAKKVRTRSRGRAPAVLILDTRKRYVVNFTS